MICTKCNAELADGYRFCPKCGTVFAYPGETPEESMRLAKIQHAKYVEYMRAKQAEQAKQAPKAMDATLPVESEVQEVEEPQPAPQPAEPPVAKSQPVPQSASQPTPQPAAQIVQQQPQQAVVIERRDYLQPRPNGYTASSYAQVYPEQRKTTSAAAITALVLGVVALGTSFLPIINNVSFFIALVGIVFAIVGIVATGKGKSKKGGGIAIGGLIINIIAVVLVIVTQSIYVAALESAIEGPKPVTTSSESSVKADYSSMNVGESVTLENGLTVTVTNVRKGIADYNGDPITEVTVSYSNGGKTNESFYPFDWKAETAEGVLDGYTIILGADNMLESGQLSPGGTVTGNLYFKGDSVKVYYYSSILSRSSSDICWIV